MSIKIIGDVHSKYDEYFKIASKSEYSLQIGDFGLTKEWFKLNYSNLNPDNHKIIPGNHCSYDLCFDSPYFLGNFGIATLNNISFFFIRGGLSIDRVYRIGEELSGGPKTYWSQEELNLSEMLECIEIYKQVKPNIVISHVPAARFTPYILGNKSDAILQKFKFHKGFKENHQLLGDELLKIHKPKTWISAHMHRSFRDNIDGVNIVALNELEEYTLVGGEHDN
jgi:hypothetical protein